MKKQEQQKKQRQELKCSYPNRLRFTSITWHTVTYARSDHKDKKFVNMGIRWNSTCANGPDHHGLELLLKNTSLKDWVFHRQIFHLPVRFFICLCSGLDFTSSCSLYIQCIQYSAPDALQSAFRRHQQLPYLIVALSRLMFLVADMQPR